MAPRSRETNEQLRSGSRRRILDAARTVFAESGYFACRVSDIARSAGMSQGNVYWHFTSKEEILRAVLADGFGALESMTAEVAALPGPASSKLETLVDRTIELYGDHAEFTTILIGLLGQGGQSLIAALGFDMRAIGGRYHANLGRVFDQARREKVVADVEADFLVACYFAFFNGLLITYADMWPRRSRDDLRAAAFRVVGYADGREVSRD